MNLQDIHDQHTVKVKYAISSNEDITRYVPGSPNYSTLWTMLPKGWTTIEEGIVDAEPGPQNARLISTPSGDIVAVEHETGLEILAVTASIVSAAAAVVSLFQTWRSNLRSGASPGTTYKDSIVIETRTKHGNGVVVSVTTTIPAYLATVEEVADLMGGAPIRT